jgi:hypothetical protein
MSQNQSGSGQKRQTFFEEFRSFETRRNSPGGTFANSRVLTPVNCQLFLQNSQFVALIPIKD